MYELFNKSQCYMYIHDIVLVTSPKCAKHVNKFLAPPPPPVLAHIPWQLLPCENTTINVNVKRKPTFGVAS